MAVRLTQIDELMGVISTYVPSDRIIPMLRAMAKTKAYVGNASFRNTIKRLTEVAERRYHG